MNAYERRMLQKQDTRRARTERERQAKLEIADRVMTNLFNAYKAATGKDTLIAYDSDTGLYRWQRRDVQRVTIERRTRELEAIAASVINPDEENS